MCIGLTYSLASATLISSKSCRTPVTRSSNQDIHLGQPDRLSRRLTPSVKNLAKHDPHIQCSLDRQPSLGRPSIANTCVAAGIAVISLLQVQALIAGSASATELIEVDLSTEGNIPSQLSAAGEQAGPRLGSLLSGSHKKQIEGCTRRCVPTCIRGGEGAPGLGPISIRKEIVVFKDGFRSRQYCLTECAQVCSLISNKEGGQSSDSAAASSSAQTP